MGCSIGNAIGIARAGERKPVMATIGDSTFLHAGLPPLIDAVYNDTNITVMLLDNGITAMTGGQVSPTTWQSMLTTTTPLGNSEPHFDACALATAAGTGYVGREVTHHVPKLKELIKGGLEHPGCAFIELLSDCTEIFGRKNDLGSSPEMVLRQKSELRPSAYRDTVDTPFRASDLPTGLLSRNDRPEYGTAYRAAAAAIRASRPERR